MQDQDKTKEQLIEELKDMRLKMVGFEAVQKSLSEKESRYRESEQRLELALEGGALGVWDWDVKTGRAIWDTGTTRMMGYEQNELDPNIQYMEKSRSSRRLGKGFRSFEWTFVRTTSFLRSRI